MGGGVGKISFFGGLAAVISAAVFAITVGQVQAQSQPGQPASKAKPIRQAAYERRFNAYWGQSDYEPGVVMVEYAETAKPGAAAAALSDQRGHNGKRFAKVAVPAGQPIEAFIADLEDDPAILSAEPNLIRHATLTPNDTSFGSQWHHTDADAGAQSPAAWDIQTGSSAVVIAIVDSGVDTDHPDLTANMWSNPGETPGNGLDDDGNGFTDDQFGYDFVDGDSDPNPAPDGNGDDSGVEHGTHVAGIAAAVGNNGLGVAGLAWDAQIMAVRVLDDEGDGTDQDIADGITYAVDNGADIINMSLGGFGTTSQLSDAVDYAQENGVLIIAAAGNTGDNINIDPFYPACYSSVVGVASISAMATASSFSNFGSDCVDLSAPGETIFSTLYTDDPAFGFTVDYGYETGTSMATPIVAGVAALIKSEVTDATRLQIRNVLEDNAVDIGLSANYGLGRVDAERALQGTDVIDAPESPGSLRAWNSSAQTTEYTDGDRQVDQQPYFTWSTPSDDDGIAGYWVSYTQNANTDPASSGTFQTSRNFTPPKQSGNELSFFLNVKAEDGEGNRSTEASSFEYIVDTVVTKPTGVKTSRKPNSIELTWDKVTGEHVDEYQIFRRGPKQDEFEKIGEAAHPATSYVDKTVRRNRTYEYRVKAHDDLGNKKASEKKVRSFYPREQVVLAAGPSGGPVVRIYDTETDSFTATWDAFDPAERAGLDLAVGNLDGDRKDEIVATLQSGGAPLVRVFEPDGELISEFLAYDAGFRGGVRVGVGDFDNDGRDEIATVPGPGGTPHVKLFELDGRLLSEFAALDGRFTGGAFVSGVNWDGVGADEIAISAGPGGGPQVTVHRASDKAVVANWFAYDQSFRNGIRLTALSSDDSNKQVVLTVPYTGTTHVQRFSDGGGVVRRLDPGFYAYDTSYTGGGSVAAGDLAQRDTDRVIVGTGGGLAATVRAYSQTGSRLFDQIPAFDAFTGAVSVASGWVNQ